MGAHPLRSAGFVLHCTGPDGVRRYLLLHHGSRRRGEQPGPTDGHWDFPKGGLKPGETDLDTARRELLEETGIRSLRTSESFRGEATYLFRRGSRVYRKTVVFFLAEADTQEVTLSDEHQDAIWLPADAAVARLTFPVSRELLRLAERSLHGSSDTPDAEAPPTR